MCTLTIYLFPFTLLLTHPSACACLQVLCSIWHCSHRVELCMLCSYNMPKSIVSRCKMVTQYYVISVRLYNMRFTWTKLTELNNGSLFTITIYYSFFCNIRKAVLCKPIWDIEIFALNHVFKDLANNFCIEFFRWGQVYRNSWYT